MKVDGKGVSSQTIILRTMLLLLYPSLLGSWSWETRRGYHVVIHHSKGRIQGDVVASWTMYNKGVGGMRRSDNKPGVHHSYLVPWYLLCLQTLQTQWWCFIIYRTSALDHVNGCISHYRKWVSLLVFPLIAAWPACRWLSLTISSVEGLRASVIWWSIALGGFRYNVYRRHLPCFRQRAQSVLWLP